MLTAMLILFIIGSAMHGAVPKPHRPNRAKQARRDAWLAGLNAQYKSPKPADPFYNVLHTKSEYAGYRRGI